RRNPQKRPVVLNEGDDVLRVPNTHPPLTDPATFEAVQRRMRLNRTRTTPVRGGGWWVLTGLAHCGACGGRTPRPRGRRGAGSAGRRADRLLDAPSRAP